MCLESASQMIQVRLCYRSGTGRCYTVPGHTLVWSEHIYQPAAHFCVKGKGKGRYSSSWEGNPTSELRERDVNCHMGSQSVTCHPIQVNAPRLTPAMQAGTRFIYPRGMEGWVDLVDLIAPRPGVELATFRSRVRRSTTAPPRHNATAAILKVRR